MSTLDKIAGWLGRRRGGAVTDSDHVTRRFVPPFGWPPKFRAVKVRASNPPKLVTLNRYPGQVIGVGIRLPGDSERGHPMLSLLWSKPARWWVEMTAPGLCGHPPESDGEQS